MQIFKLARVLGVLELQGDWAAHSSPRPPCIYILLAREPGRIDNYYRHLPRGALLLLAALVSPIGLT